MDSPEMMTVLVGDVAAAHATRAKRTATRSMSGTCTCAEPRRESPDEPTLCDRSSPSSAPCLGCLGGEPRSSVSPKDEHRVLCNTHWTNQDLVQPDLCASDRRGDRRLNRSTVMTESTQRAIRAHH